MPTVGINSCPSPVSEPWTPFLRTRGSRNHGRHQRPQQARWEFRRWDGALPLKAADAPEERQTQNGISELRFENSQDSREPCLASVFPEGACRGQLQSALSLGKTHAARSLWASPLACAVLLSGWVYLVARGRGYSLRQ